MKTRNMIFAMLLLAFVVSHSDAQSPRLMSDQIGEAGLSFEFWRAKDDQLMQFALPMTYVYPWSDKVRYYAMTTPAFSSTNQGDNYNLAGLSDVKLGGHVLALNDEVLFTFGLNLPTGKSALKESEIPVVNVLTIPAFNMRAPTLGQGLDIQLGLSTAWELGDYIIGYGVSLLRKGGFEPLSSLDKKYDPGNEVSFTWGANRLATLFGREMRLTGDMTYTAYSSDEWGGNTVYASGNRMVIQLMSQFAEGDWDMMLFIRDRIKAKNEWTRGDGMLQPEDKNSNGNQLEIQGCGFYPYKPDLRIKAIADIKMYANNAKDNGGVFLFGLGGGAQKILDDQLMLNGECRVYMGSMKSGAERNALFGLKLYGGIQYTF